MHAENPTAKVPDNLGHALIWYGLVIVIYTILFSWQSWKEEKTSRIREMTTIAEMGEKAVDQYFMQMEADLQNLALNWLDRGEQLNLEQCYADARRYKQLRPELVNLTMIRPDGEVLFTAKTAPGVNPHSLAKEASFKEYLQILEQAPAFKVGQPIFGSTSKVWIIPMRLLVRGSKGQPLFILSANLPVEFLQTLWRDAPITKSSSLGLIRDDGFLISRYPNPYTAKPEAIYGQARTGTFIRYLQSNQFPRSGVNEGVSSLTGEGVVNVFQRLTHYPLTMFVLTPVADIHASWWQKVKVAYSLTFLLLTSIGITGLLAARQRRAWAREQERIDKLKAEFISVVSHELRTPITSIRGALGLLEAGKVGALPENALKLVSIAHKNSQRLSNLVNDILDMEKLMLGKISFKMEELNLGEVVAHCVESNAAYAQRFETRISFNKPQELCKVIADNERLQQVLANLISNACKFSPPGGEVLIQILDQDKEWRVSVSDQGQGVPAAFQQRIFEAFAQADATNTRQQGGTGLGLHISKSLIHNMQGQIGFESKEGMGSTFWISLRKP